MHKDSISVAVLPWGQESAEVDKIFHDEPSVRRLIARFDDPGRLRACYEAGPTGYELARLLARLRVRCDVVAPSLIPRAPGDRVKTDRRDARRLARLHRAGELVAIRVPSPTEEAVRDLCRARADVVDDRRRARQRLGKFLLRHGRVYRDGGAWTVGHDRWLAAQTFAEPALAATYARYRGAVSARDAELAAIEADLAVWYDRDPFADQVRRLAAYRGVDRLGALTLAAEVCDWRRFGRATAFMGFTGLVPLRVLLRPVHPPRPSHQGRQRPSAHPASRVRLGLPQQGDHRRRAARPPRGCTRRHPGPLVDRAAAAVRPLCAGWPNVRTSRPWSPPPSPASWPASCGRR